MEVIRDTRLADEVANGTHKVGDLTNVHYEELSELFGEPTYTAESFDGKIQVEWVIEFNDRHFTIYDWKTYNREYTLNELLTWSIGGLNDPSELKLFIYQKLNLIWKERLLNS